WWCGCEPRRPCCGGRSTIRSTASACRGVSSPDVTEPGARASACGSSPAPADFGGGVTARLGVRLEQRPALRRYGAARADVTGGWLVGAKSESPFVRSHRPRRCPLLRGDQTDTHGGHPEDAEPCDPAFVSRRGCGECAHDDRVSEDSAHDEQSQPCSLDMTPLDAECAEGDEQQEAHVESIVVQRRDRGHVERTGI